MPVNNLWYNWLEAEEPNAGQAPQVDPNAQVVPAAQGQGGPSGPPQQPQQQQPEDNVEDDPQDPDQDEEDTAEKDFEQWKHDFCELSIKGNVEEMLSAISQVNERTGLEPSQRRFIGDNMQILLYRQDANVLNGTKQIRNLIKEDLDRTNPGTTLMQHLMSVVEKDLLLAQPLVKITGFLGQKGEIHRKWVGALLGAIQVGGGGNRQDLIYFDKDYSINISTRFATQFGEVNLGKWNLKADDPSRYLTDPEMDRLSDGSPEEKQTLRRRIMLESIGEKFKERAYLIHIVHPDGTIHSLGWDLGDSLLSAYKDGKIVVRGKQNSEKDAMISDTGDIVTLIDLDILFVQETGETDENGKPEMTEIPFLEQRNCTLYLVADLDTLQTASSSLSGMFFHETPWNGNPAEVLSLSQCSPSLPEILGRKCAP